MSESGVWGSAVTGAVIAIFEDYDSTVTGATNPRPALQEKPKALSQEASWFRDRFALKVTHSASTRKPQGPPLPTPLPCIEKLQMTTLMIWAAFVLLALLWTGGVALLVQLVEWSIPALASASQASAGTMVLPLSLPSWLSTWIDAADWAAAQQAVTDTVASLPAVLPFIGELTTWLVPVVWVIWGMGLLALLTLALAATWLSHRMSSPDYQHGTARETASRRAADR